MKSTLFTGAGIAIITPMNDDLSVNYQKLGELINSQIRWHTDAIIICGTTGEASTLTDEEHIEVIKYAIKCVNGRVPVIAGTGSNDTAYSIHLSKEAEKVGADGVLLVTPYYNKTTQSGLIEHFGMVADSIKIPVILYNIPGRTGMNIEIPTIKKLAERDNIVAVKEASGNIGYVAKLMAECKNVIDVYSGNDDMILPIMSLGGKGVISVLSHLMPFETHKMVEFCLRNNFEDAIKTQLDLMDLINALFIEVNPIPVKYALNTIGMKVGPCRPPLCEMENHNKIIMNKALLRHLFTLTTT